jgi:hypothetical protein
MFPPTRVPLTAWVSGAATSHLNIQSSLGVTVQTCGPNSEDAYSGAGPDLHVFEVKTGSVHYFLLASRRAGTGLPADQRRKALVEYAFGSDPAVPGAVHEEGEALDVTVLGSPAVAKRWKIVGGDVVYYQFVIAEFPYEAGGQSFEVIALLSGLQAAPLSTQAVRRALGGVIVAQ